MKTKLPTYIKKKKLHTKTFIYSAKINVLIGVFNVITMNPNIT
jgi:hypothetical protein